MIVRDAGTLTMDCLAVRAETIELRLSDRVADSGRERTERRERLRSTSGALAGLDIIRIESERFTGLLLYSRMRNTLGLAQGVDP